MIARRLLSLFALITVCVMICSCSFDGNADDVTSLPKAFEKSQEVGKKLPQSFTVSLSTSASTQGNQNIKLPDEIDEKYLDPILKKLNDAPYACALYYVDLETGLSISYNENRFFAGASLIKAEYMLSIFEDIKTGKISFDSKYTYTSANKRGGTTKIPYEKNYGDKLTLKEIIEYLIYHSDNTAYNMLLSYVRSYNSFADWAKEKYGTTFYFSGCNWLNAVGVAECWKDIYYRWRSGDEDFVWYVELLKLANENKFIKGGLPKGEDGTAIYEVAHKYGMDITASNDAAIVFCGDRPYFLVILTDYIGYNTQSFMNSVSSLVYDLHQYICSENEAR